MLHQNRIIRVAETEACLHISIPKSNASEMMNKTSSKHYSHKQSECMKKGIAFRLEQSWGYNQRRERPFQISTLSTACMNIYPSQRSGTAKNKGDSSGLKSVTFFGNMTRIVICERA